MLKKIISVILSLCVVLCFASNAFAVENNSCISLKLNSNISGLTCYDQDKLIEIDSANVVLKSDDPILTADYAGTQTDGKLKAGRTYYIYYTLVAADGYTLPDTVSKDDIDIRCEKGVGVVSAQIVNAEIKDDNGNTTAFRGLMIFAKVKVDGNIFQRTLGFFYDNYLKIKAWSPY